MITDAAKMEEAVKGQLVESLCITKDDTAIDIHFQSGDCLSICGKLIPFMDLTPELEIEVRINEKI